MAIIGFTCGKDFACPSLSRGCPNALLMPRDSAMPQTTIGALKSGIRTAGRAARQRLSQKRAKLNCAKPHAVHGFARKTAALHRSSFGDRRRVPRGIILGATSFDPRFAGITSLGSYRTNSRRDCHVVDVKSCQWDRQVGIGMHQIGTAIGVGRRFEVGPLPIGSRPE
jgi:hypothetical protein